MESASPLTVTRLVAETTAALEGAGFQQVEAPISEGWPDATVRVYEDPYSIAAVVVYETWAQLASSWLDAQAALVELISEYFARGDAKSWDGYLVLLTPSVEPDDSNALGLAIRRDTAHVRKFLGTANELGRPGGVEQLLLPLLPLEQAESVESQESPLSALPRILARREVPEDVSEVVVHAFENQEPLMDRLHRHLHPDRDPP